MTLVQVTNYTSPNCTDRPQVNIYCIENFFTVHDSWATCACPETTELPWHFSLYWIYFLHSGFLTTFTCPENRVSLKFFTVLNIFFTIQDFWATLCFLYCPLRQSQFELQCKRRREYRFTFYIQEFWATCACAKKQSCPDIFLCIEHLFFII